MLTATDDDKGPTVIVWPDNNTNENDMKEVCGITCEQQVTEDLLARGTCARQKQSSSYSEMQTQDLVKYN